MVLNSINMCCGNCYAQTCMIGYLAMSSNFGSLKSFSPLYKYFLARTLLLLFYTLAVRNINNNNILMLLP